MTTARPLLFNLTLVTAMTLALTGVLRHEPASPEWPPPPEAPCTPQGLRVVSELYPSSVAKSADGHLLTLPAVLAAQSCQPGIWIVSAASAGVGEAAPVLSVGVNGRVSRSVPVPGKQVERIAVTGPARLSLAFLNQAYAVDLRHLKLLRVLLRDRAGCPVTPAQVDPTTGSWQADTGSGDLFGEGTLTLQTCGATQAVLRLQGQQFQGVWPQLEMRNDAGQVQRLEVAGNRTVTFDLTGARTFQLRLLNPASVTTQNSRLWLDARFVPTETPD